MSANNYDHRNIDTMELVYGTGYMSAGGDNEVLKIFEGIDVQGKDILDLGCGLGGAAITIAKNLNPSHVVGFDIDPIVMQRAEKLVKKSDLENEIELDLNEPGPLPYKDNSFDVIHLTAVSCHMQDLKEFFTDVFRVLKPSGWLVGSEWMIGKYDEGFYNFDHLLRKRGLNFYFVEPEKFKLALQQAKFEKLQVIDRTTEFTNYSLTGLEKVTNELKLKIIALLGKSGYQDLVEWSEIRLAGLESASLLQQHFRGQKI